MSTSNNTTVIDSSVLQSSVIVTLNLILTQYISYLPLIFIIFGVIGFIGNAFTFLQPELRSTTFCIYTLCSSIADISNLIFNRIPRYLYQVYGYKFAWDTNSSLCKFEVFTLLFLPQLAINLLILSLIDRYASTCGLTSSIRHLNKPKKAIWFIGIIIIYSSFAVFHGPVFNGIDTSKGCIATAPLTNSILYLIFCGLMQPVVMLIFVFLTYQNIRKRRQRVGVVVTRRTNNPRNQFIGLVFIQVFVTGFISLQWITVYAYYTITLNNSKTEEEQTIITFAYLTANYILTFNSVKSFYLSTLTCRLFRQTFLKALFKMLPNRLNDLGFTIPATVLTNKVDYKSKEQTNNTV